MESWYGLVWNHQNKHRELLQHAERERLANEIRSHRPRVSAWNDSLLGVATLAVVLGILRMAWGMSSGAGREA